VGESVPCPTLFLAWRRRRGRSVSAAIVSVRRFSRDADIKRASPEHGVLKLCGLVFDCDGLVKELARQPDQAHEADAPAPTHTSDPIYTGFPYSCFRRRAASGGCMGVRTCTAGRGGGGERQGKHHCQPFGLRDTRSGVTSARPFKRISRLLSTLFSHAFRCAPETTPTMRSRRLTHSASRSYGSLWRATALRKFISGNL
jgi:hypothetical protein